MRRLVAVLILLLLMVPAVAAKKDAGLEQRVELLERKVKTFSELMLRMDALQREIQQMRGDLELQSHEMEALKKRQRDLYLDIDRRLSQISGDGSASTPPAPSASSLSPQSRQYPQSDATSDTSPATKEPKPASAVAPGDPALEQQAYQKAFNLLMQKRYADSRKALQGFLAKYPGSEYADNAQYWLAESNYVERDFDSALDGFSKVIDQYPDSLKVSDAMLKSGYIQYEMKEWSKAKETFSALSKRYPGSTASSLAQKRLDKMRTEGR